ncbi:NUDIX domain-containing protein [Fictibacillus nanhaiensis]|uniref:NUDIX domain-containing protein n=1 Tax=Fictibacillus nanhaiensis TaxID=742169 RepID=UPI001C95B425|nr:NUDIX domain-containing protein [Fictibacillus nanhaiensis]MBY6038098.1 NUDIX domain-containing protein [Fictibacillus nanhaiensis]
MRAPYQVLVLPYIVDENTVKYAVFNRADDRYWQGIAGGGEEGETIIEAARREAFEEAGLTSDLSFLRLDSISSIPVEHVVGTFLWGDEVYVINEYSFGVEVLKKDLSLSKEHSFYKWVSYDEALSLLKWDSNKTALWELNRRVLKQINEKKKKTF